ncbi:MULTISPECIES: RNA polymerase sigma factor [Bacillus]|uniref:RNA polymerase sigma factor n=1 Tax=Bacillus TaxID=1386 RepID=UPI00077195CE|nr:MULTISPECIES: RNA polymerase sigma factor [Bacillus]OUA68153.1 RNA polymerase subunit sigma-24 [Bacillus thuringiensis serovar thailandensis]KAB7631096.1 RNA polymerase sigma factor [Bacillus sp. B4-WWTP-NA-D-NA-NA]KXI53122.1 RNA polymerase subunit sigma-24 [Bacillus cereus]MCZ7523368.1 RNA polymerase sigma factor [Bacillus pacificus]MDA1574745.1 RNA polymerase sigma factor [Bacillus cereus group sp. TH242-3LC]
MEQKELTEWFNKYGDSILTYTLLMVRDYQQAEDLTQETFIKAYRHQQQFEQKSSVKTWLFSIAHNVTKDYFRKKHPLQHYLGLTMEEKDYKPIPEQIVAMNFQNEQLYRTIQQLKPSYRHVIILRKLKEFSTKETVFVLNWSESKVKMTLKRALVELKNELIRGGITNEIL